MRLTSFTDYGLRVLMRLAGSPGSALSTAQMAREFKLSRNHLAKVITRLSTAGYLTTRRGGGGGVMLAIAPCDIQLGEVVRLLEENQALVECFGASGTLCTLTPHCRLKSVLARAETAFLNDLNTTTLADCTYQPAPAA